MNQCINCRHYTDCSQYTECDGPICFCYSPWTKPYTNADEIRHMDNEELADFLGNWARRHLAWMQDGRGEVLWWLQQNV